MIDDIKISTTAIDLPQIIKDIIDFLQPALSPYETVIYWYMFRDSIAETGDNFTRGSVTCLSKGIGSKF